MGLVTKPGPATKTLLSASLASLHSPASPDPGGLGPSIVPGAGCTELGPRKQTPWDRRGVDWGQGRGRLVVWGAASVHRCD